MEQLPQGGGDDPRARPVLFAVHGPGVRDAPGAVPRVAGIADMDATNRHIPEVYMPRFNRELSRPAREEGTAFVLMADTGALDNILREVHEGTVGCADCAGFEGKKLQLPGDRCGPHHMKARVKVRRHMDGHLSVWHGPRLLQRYADDGRPNEKATREVAGWGVNPERRRSGFQSAERARNSCTL